MFGGIPRFTLVEQATLFITITMALTERVEKRMALTTSPTALSIRAVGTFTCCQHRSLSIRELRLLPLRAKHSMLTLTATSGAQTGLGTSVHMNMAVVVLPTRQFMLRRWH